MSSPSARFLFRMKALGLPVLLSLLSAYALTHSPRVLAEEIVVAGTEPGTNQPIEARMEVIVDPAAIQDRIENLARQRLAEHETLITEVDPALDESKPGESTNASTSSRLPNVTCVVVWAARSSVAAVTYVYLSSHLTPEAAIIASATTFFLNAVWDFNPDRWISLVSWAGKKFVLVKNENSRTARFLNKMAATSIPTTLFAFIPQAIFSLFGGGYAFSDPQFYLQWIGVAALGTFINSWETFFDDLKSAASPSALPRVRTAHLVHRLLLGGIAPLVALGMNEGYVVGISAAAAGTAAAFTIDRMGPQNFYRFSADKGREIFRKMKTRLLETGIERWIPPKLRTKACAKNLDSAA